MLDTNILLSSLFWGTVGTGYVIYGKKQSAAVPLIGGLSLVALSYFIGHALLLSVISIAIIAAMHWLMRRGF